MPRPPALLDALNLVHCIRRAWSRRGKGRSVRLWPWLPWSRIDRLARGARGDAVMEAAGLDGQLAQGAAGRLRVGGRLRRHPADLVREWLGHADFTTTAINADAIDAAEKAIAQRSVRVATSRSRAARVGADRACQCSST